MQVKIDMTKLDRGDNIRAFGTLKFGEIIIKSLTLMMNSNGELFLQMPCRDTGKKDKDENRVFEDIIHPTTKELRDILNAAAIESYEKGRPVTLRENKEGMLLIEAQAFDSPFFNKVGKGQILINDEFVIKNIFINEGKNKSLYVTLPNFKSNETKDGKPVFKEIVIMNNNLKKRICESIINEYKRDLANRQQNRFTIKSRLEEAKKKASEHSENQEHTTKEAVL